MHGSIFDRHQSMLLTLTCLKQMAMACDHEKLVVGTTVRVRSVFSANECLIGFWHKGGLVYMVSFLGYRFRQQRRDAEEEAGQE
jgi:hypothetical protein